MISIVFAQIQLVPDLAPLLLNIALILLMIWVLNRTFFRPINRILEERERKSGRGNSAGDILNRVNEKAAAYENAMRDARSTGYHLMEETRTSAIAARQSQINTVKEEVTALIESEKNAIGDQATEARAALSSDAQKMAETITSTILKN